MHCTAAGEVSSAAAASGSRQERSAVCGVRQNFQITCNMERKQSNDFVLIRTRYNPAESNTHTSKMFFFFFFGNSLHGPVSWTHTKGNTSEIAIVQPAEYPRTSPPGSRVSEHMPLYSSYVRQCSVSRTFANGALGAWKNHNGKDEEDHTGLGRAELLY